MKWQSLLTAVALIVCGSAATVQADIIIDVQDTTIEVGGTRTVNVLIRSTGTDDFDFASYVFGITDVGGTPNTDLIFSDPQSTAEAAAGPTYVFGTDFSSGGLFFDVNSPTEVEGSDGTDSATPITLTTAPLLLATLDLELSPFGGTLGVGEQFRITALPTSVFSGSNTEFFDGATAATIDADSFNPLGVGGGLITVTAASAAVPEPGTVGLLSVLAAFGCMRTLRRSRVSNEERSPA